MRKAFALAFVIGLCFATVSANPLKANPVPYPLISMEQEFINANITVSGEGGYAEVNTSYPFTNAGYSRVSMCYPLPVDSTDVEVEVGGNVTDWVYMNETYETVFGDLPVINWTVSPVPDQFVVGVRYEHEIIVEDGVYRYFYAMGTWKHLAGLYTKDVSAFVTMSVHMGILRTETLDLNVSEVTWNSTTGEWQWDALPYTLVRVGNTFEIEVWVHSEWRPIMGDLVVSFRKSLAGDLNLDGAVDIGDALLLASCFGYRHRWPVDPRYPDWISGADCCPDGVIDVFDAIILSNNFGKFILQ